MNVLAPADSAGGAGEEESLPGAREPGQLLALYQAAHLILLLALTSCLSLAPHVVRQVAGVGPVCPDQLSLAHPRQRGVTHVTSRTCTQKEVVLNGAQWASLGVEMDKTPGGNFLDILCCK